jgi:hypothetical protein
MSELAVAISAPLSAVAERFGILFTLLRNGIGSVYPERSRDEPDATGVCLAARKSVSVAERGPGTVVARTSVLVPRESSRGVSLGILQILLGSTSDLAVYKRFGPASVFDDNGKTKKIKNKKKEKRKRKKEKEKKKKEKKGKKEKRKFLFFLFCFLK